MDFPEDIYSTRILEVVASMPEMVLLTSAEGTSSKHSKLCGSKVHVDVCLDDEGRISDYSHRQEACLLGQTTAALVARNAIGLSLSEVIFVRDQMLKMLKEGGEPPKGKWADLDVLYPVKDYKPRHASMMLVFDAVIEAMKCAAKKKGISLKDEDLSLDTETSSLEP